MRVPRLEYYGSRPQLSPVLYVYYTTKMLSMQISSPTSSIPRTRDVPCSSWKIRCSPARRGVRRRGRPSPQRISLRTGAVHLVALFFVLRTRKQLTGSCGATSVAPHPRGEGAPPPRERMNISKFLLAGTGRVGSLARKRFARRLPLPAGEGGGEGRTPSPTVTRRTVGTRSQPTQNAPTSERCRHASVIIAPSSHVNTGRRI